MVPFAEIIPDRLCDTSWLSDFLPIFRALWYIKGIFVNIVFQTDTDVSQSNKDIIVANQIPRSPAVKTSHPSKSETTNDSPSSEALEAVRGFMAAFAKAIKSYSLYPETHTISENILSGLESSLTNFFQTSPDLKLDIEKERICFKGIEVYQQNGREDYLVTPFFRDGIIWIEFGKGATAAELSFLLGMLSEYRILTDESEGDLVTALWKKNLPHIHYEAVEVFWETEPRLDFSHFSVSGSSKGKSNGPSGLGHGSTAGKQQGGSGDAGNQSTLSIVSTEVKRSLMQLTSAETEILQKLIIEEEHRNRSEDVLDVFLIILEDEDEKETFSNILELLVQEFENILRHGEFQLGVKILDFLKKLPDRDAAKKIWRDPLVDQYFESVSDSEILEALKAYLPDFKSEDATRLKIFRQVLLMLRPKAVLTLGPLLSEVSSAAARRRMMEAIAILSKQDLSPLSQLLKIPDEVLVQRFVTILGHLDGKQPQRLLLNMARHSSLGVRREALKQLLKRTGRMHRSFFFLLEDPSDIIRREILNRMAAERNRTSEDPLLEYLNEKAFNISGRDHILACYKTLGKCGSSRSILFLETTLEGRPWSEIFNFSGSVHRRGAAMALAELGMPKADKILKRASRSFFPHIRRASRSAIPGRRPA
jgi:HEAT repeat protein